MGNNPGHYYNIHADKKYYIKQSIDTILKQKYYREFDPFIKSYYRWLKKNRDNIFKQLKNNKKAEEVFSHPRKIKIFYYIFNFTKIKKHIKTKNKDYKNQKYHEVSLLFHLILLSKFYFF